MIDSPASLFLPDGVSFVTEAPVFEMVTVFSKLSTFILPLPTKILFIFPDDDDAVFRHNVTSSYSTKSSTSISSPLSSSQKTSFISPVTLASPMMIHHPSAFHPMQMRDNPLSGVTGDEKGNEVTDSKVYMSFSLDASPLVHHTSAFHKFPIKEK